MTSRPLLRRLDHYLALSTKVLSAFGLALLTGLSLCIVADVILRWAFAAPIEGLSEVTSLLAAVIIGSFFPLSLHARRHASIRVMPKLLGPKAAAIFDQFSALIVLIFFCLMAWQFARYTAELAEAGERTWILQLDVSLWWAAVTVLLAAAALVQAGQLVLRFALGAETASDAP